jgi:hypothetical protein
VHIEKVRADQLDELTDFLRRIFQADEPAGFLERRLMEWKYFESRPDWDGTRSYVLRVRGRIAAHGGIVPTTLLLPERSLLSVQVIDWAADRAFAGAGLLLLNELIELGDLSIGPGGSQQGMQILKADKTGTRVLTETVWFVRVIRPWLKFRQGGRTAFKPVARLGRDTVRLLHGSWRARSRWSARKVTTFEDPLAMADRTAQEFMPIVRSADQLNYMLRCPAVKMYGYLLDHEGESRGHLLLSQSGSEVRIVDLQVASASEDDWQSCARLALDLAMGLQPESAVVVAMALPLMLRRALLAAGFSEVRRKTCYTQDRNSLLVNQAIPNLSMIDTDAAYL